MRIISILRAGILALALAVTTGAVAPAFAASSDVPQTQQNQIYSAGPYDGASFEAAKHAFN